MSKKVIVTDAAALTKQIGAIGTHAGKLAASVQLALASAAFHAIAHGNINPVNGLFDAAGKGMRRSAIQNWLVAFAPVVVNDAKDGDHFVFSRPKVEALLTVWANATGLETLDAKAPTLEQAEAYAEHVFKTDWIDFSPEKLPPAEFDVLAMLGQLVKKVHGLQKAGSKAKHGDLITQLEALVAPKVEAVAPL